MKRYFKYIFITLILVFMGIGSVGADRADQIPNENNLSQTSTKKEDIEYCSYDDGDNKVSFTIQQKSVINKKTGKVEGFTTSVPQSKITVEKYNGKSNPSIKSVKFDWDDTKTSCPNYMSISKGGTSYNNSYIYTLKFSSKKSELSGTVLSSQKITDKEKERTKKNNASSTEITSCSQLGETLNYLKQAYNFLKYLVPVLIILLSAIDFVKAVADDETRSKNIFSTAWKRLVIRIVVGIVILLLPILIGFIVDISGITGMNGVTENNIYCIFK